MWQIVEKRNIFFSWLLWHYSVALDDIVKRWKDLLRFNLDYFSIPFLLQTMFSPWKRYKLSFGRGFDISKIFEVIVFNTFSRLIGAAVRMGVILCGLIIHLALIFFGIFILLIWIALPIIIIGGILVSLR